MAILFLTNDLMFSSRVTAVARSTGATVQVVNSAEKLLEHLGKPDVKEVFIDLTAPGLQIQEAAKQIQASPNPPRLIAFGPHVREELLQAARDAGCDTVLTNGQFNANMRELLAPSS